MKAKRRWQDLSPKEQTLVLTAASIEIALTATALVDLIRRPRAQVRGPKPLWALALGVQPVGPIAYLTLGINRGQ